LSAQSYFGLISYETSLILSGLTSCLSLALYAKIKHSLYVYMAAIGSFCVPIISQRYADGVLSGSYLAGCSFVFGAFSLLMQNHRLILLSLYLGLIGMMVAGLHFRVDSYWTVMYAAHLSIQSLAALALARKSPSFLSERMALAYFPALALFYFLEYCGLNRIHLGWGAWAGLGLAVFLTCVGWAARKGLKMGQPAQYVWTAFTALVAVHSVYFHLLPETVRDWVLVPTTMLMAFLPKQFLVEDDKGSLKAPVVAALLLMAFPYCNLILELDPQSDPSFVFLGSATFLSCWLLLVQQPLAFSIQRFSGLFILACAHILGLTLFYRIGCEFNRLSVSVFWLFYGIAVMAFGIKCTDANLNKSALLILSLAAGRALVLDMAREQSYVRVLCLILIGAVLYGCGLFLRRYNKPSPFKETKQGG
jgi:hypothetical protein